MCLGATNKVSISAPVIIYFVIYYYHYFDVVQDSCVSNLPSGQNRQKKQSEGVRECVSKYRPFVKNTLLHTAFSAILPTGL